MDLRLDRPQTFPHFALPAEPAAFPVENAVAQCDRPLHRLDHLGQVDFAGSFRQFKSPALSFPGNDKTFLRKDLHQLGEMVQRDVHFFGRLAARHLSPLRRQVYQEPDRKVGTTIDAHNRHSLYLLWRFVNYYFLPYNQDMADFIKFLGTAGARVVMAKQLRSSGGIWISLDGTNLYLDPGPGALVHCFRSRPKLDPATLDAILLSHRHLDHSGDINVMIEAMTDGTFKKRGTVFAPADALDDDPVILKYVRKYPEKIERLEIGKKYKVGNLAFTCPVRHIHHGSETYGFIIKGKKKSVAYLSDTVFFPELLKAYRADVLIINVLMPAPYPIEHMNLIDAKKIIKAAKPKTAILTHFGRRMLAAKPWLLAEEATKELKIKVVAAGDGLNFKI